MDKLNEKSVNEILGVRADGLNPGSSLIRQDDQNLVGTSRQKRTDRTVKIPKEIMQTWKSKDLPKQWESSQQSLKTLMPTWNYTLMTDADNIRFVETHFPDFLFYFRGFEYPIQRADAIRYMWLYVKGGIYVDLDLEILKPLDDLFIEDADVYVVRSANITSVYTNAFMAAKPRLHLMLRCLEEMKAPYAFWHVGKHLKVINSTGPNMFTRSIEKEIKENNLSIHSESNDSSTESVTSRSRNGLKLKELPGELIISCSVCEPRPCAVEDGYCRLLGGSSWSEGDTAFWTSVYCNRHQLIVLFVIIVIVIATVIIVYRKKLFRRNRY